MNSRTAMLAVPVVGALAGLGAGASVFASDRAQEKSMKTSVERSVGFGLAAMIGTGIVGHLGVSALDSFTSLGAKHADALENVKMGAAFTWVGTGAFTALALGFRGGSEL